MQTSDSNVIALTSRSVARPRTKEAPRVAAEAPLSVLIIDDTPEDRMVVRLALESQGYLLNEVDTGERGLAAAAALQPDCILLDYHLPDLDGDEVLDALRRSDGAMPCAVVMLTGSSNGETAARLIKAGALDYLRKERLFEDNLRRAVQGAVERHRLIEEGRRTEERNAYLAAIVAASTDAIVSTGVNDRVMSWNPGAETMFGYAEHEAVGRTIEELIVPPPMIEQRRKLYADVRAGHVAIALESERRRKDGSLLPVEINASPMFNGAGVVSGISVVIRDIAERKRAEANMAFLAELGQALAPLEASEDVARIATQRLVDYFAAARCMLVTIDEAQDRAMVFHDYAADGLPSLVGSYPIFEFHPKQERAQLVEGKPIVIQDTRAGRPAEAADRFASLGVGALVNIPHMHRGRWKFMLSLARAEPTEWRDDQVELLREVATRVYLRLERARSEDALRESEARFRQVAESLPQMVWTCEADGPCDWLSSQWVRYTGIPEATQLGYGWLEQLHPGDREPTIAAWREAAGAGKDYAGEFRIRRHDGAYRWFRTLAVPLRDGNGAIQKWFGSNTDIHDIVEAEERLHERVRQLDLLARISQKLLFGREVERVLLESIFRETAEHLGVEMFYHYRPAEQPRLLRLDACGGISAQERQLFATMRFGELLCGRVAETRERLIVEDLQHSTQPGSEVLNAAGATSYAGFPLVAYGELVGTVAFISRERVHFRDGDMQVLQTICDQIATSLERARLERELCESEEGLSRAQNIAHIGSWELDIVGDRLSWSDETYRIFGLRPQEFSASYEAFLEAVHPDDRDTVDAAYSASVRDNRDTYEIEHRILRKSTGEVRIVHERCEHLRDDEGRIVRSVGMVQDITERKQAEDHVQLLMREVSHRSKNMLGLVQAIARQTAATRSEDFIESFEQRVQALAASQDLLVNSDWKNVALGDLVRSQLAHFGGARGTRVSLHGPPVEIAASASQGLGMALHELATNAAKYGALSNDAGRVAISWAVLSDAPGNTRFKMEWVESGGPLVAKPTRRGFGSTVIGRMIKMSFGCDAEIDFAPTGFVWRIDCAAERVLEGRSAPSTPRLNGATAAGSAP
ncbi:PAS domain S-box protein [Methylocystis sp. H62]|uniref:PAS domain S-box protein n=1 Tax=Methylocystis sp. H62 TaxID=2785789 RepID=UPI0018C2061A|nr:PAS domain S-box protein [Methylocystis sp. H62]MBG0794252.1 PAS domain S-box protein [Methylocystis sp. H62]